MIVTLPPALRFAPFRILKELDCASNREELVSSIIVACLSALLFTGIGLLWFLANVKLRPNPNELAIVLALSVVTIGYCTIRFSAVIATVLGFILAIKIGAVFGAANGYLVYSAGAPFQLIDAQLYAVDRWLGFDWLAMLRWFAEYPVLVEVTRVAYDQAPIQAVLALPLLIVARQNDRLMKLLSATFLALVIVHIVAIFLPAVGVYGYLGLSAADHPHMVLSSEGRTVVHVMQLRTGALFDLTRNPMMGLITFPSFHMVMAIQAIWAFWQMPLLRWPTVVINFFVWVGTLFHGSHHFVDTVAGAVVAVGSIVAACKLTQFVRMKCYPLSGLKVQSPKSTLCASAHA